MTPVLLLQKTLPSVQKILRGGFRIGIIPHEGSVYQLRLRKKTLAEDFPGDAKTALVDAPSSSVCTMPMELTLKNYAIDIRPFPSRPITCVVVVGVFLRVWCVPCWR